MPLVDVGRVLQLRDRGHALDELIQRDEAVTRPIHSGHQPATLLSRWGHAVRQLEQPLQLALGERAGEVDVELVEVCGDGALLLFRQAAQVLVALGCGRTRTVSVGGQSLRGNAKTQAMLPPRSAEEESGEWIGSTSGGSKAGHGRQKCTPMAEVCGAYPPRPPRTWAWRTAG